MGNSKIVYYGETLIDLTGDTVEPAKLLKGITAHDKKGEKITGTFEAAAPYAIISVTYPAGSVCTCSNGSVTLTAKDTSGKALFTIPEAGTWTVTAVSGSKSTSKAVSITTEGQVETVELMFELILFDGSNGGDVTSLTGGWDNDGHNGSVTFSVDSDAIRYNYSVDQSAGEISRTWCIFTKNRIDIAGYTTLKMTFKTMSGGKSWGIAVNTTNLETLNPWYTANPQFTAKVAITTIEDNQTLTLSIDNVTKGYVLAYVTDVFYSYIAHSCTITKVWLE